jgi:processing peptidase subunit alpha
MTPQTAASSSGLMDRLLGKSSMPRVPLSQNFSNRPLTSQEHQQAPAEEAQTTTLPNGIRVVTQANYSPIANMGLFVETGSRFESRANNGINHFIEAMAFKSTNHRSDFRLVRDMSRLGANVMCAASRETVVYSGECLRPFIPYVAKMIAEIALHPAYHDFEVRAAALQYKKLLKERSTNVDHLLMESVHAAAYRDNTLGRSIYAPLHNLSKFTPEALEAHRRAWWTPSRMVIAGVGVDHTEFVQIMGAWFGELEAEVGGSTGKEAAVYTGGELKMHNPELTDGAAHFALAFETASWHDEADLVPMCVLQMMFGGGGSFSVGGPGKGMYSRLYENVLNKYPWAHHVASFNSINSDSSLFGIYGTSNAENSAQLADVIVDEYAKAASAPCGEQELVRAKNALKSAVYMQLESRAMALDDVGRQLLTYNKVNSPHYIAQLIDKVSPQDITRVAQKMLKTQPTIAAAGDLSFLPRYDQITQKLSSS